MLGAVTPGSRQPAYPSPEESHPADVLQVSLRFLRDEVHDDGVEIFLASYDGTVLRRVEATGVTLDEALPVVPGQGGAVRAFQSEESVVESGLESEQLVFIALSLHGERLGVLQVPANTARL